MRENTQATDTKPDKELEKKIDALIGYFDRLYPSTRKMIWRSFLHGLFMGLGTTIGLSLLVALVTFILHQAKVMPLLEEMIDVIQIEQVFPQK